jgi:P-type Cu+ transporter
MPMTAKADGAAGGTRLELAIGGMTCAACAARVTTALEAVPGVRAANVNLMLHKASVETEGKVSAAAIVAAVKAAGYDATPGPKEAAETGPPFWLVAACAVLCAPFLLQMAAMALGFNWALDPWLQLALAAPVQFIAGARFYWGAWKAVSRASGNMDLLVALGSTAAFGLSLWLMFRGGHAHALYFEAAAVVVTMVLFGQWLEGRARARATEAIRGLMELQPETARREADGRYETVAAASLAPGDVVLVAAGERVPADGEILSGESELDQALMTGESVPVPVKTGSRALAGAMNGMGALRMRVTASADDSGLGRMIASVSAAQIAKGETGRMVDRISAVFVPIVLALAVATFVGWMATGAVWTLSLEHAIAVLVIACPCALGLATPAAMVAGSGAAARAGILLRDLDAIEAAHGVTLVAMDKTGTLTLGRPKVLAADAVDGNTAQLVYWAAAAQSGLKHPIAYGLAEAALSDGRERPAPDAMRAIPGQGVVAQFGAKRIAVGNAKLMTAEGADLGPMTAKAKDWAAQGATLVYVAADGVAQGVIALRDELRPEAADSVAMLRAAGYRVVVLSGDAPETVRRVAQDLGLDEAYGGLSPEDKARFLRERAAQGERAAFVGDGVNDAPALSEAALGVAVANAAGVAGEAAAITIVKPDLRLVPAALDIANRTRGKIRQNLFWAFVYNVVGLPLAALGLLSPVLAGTAMALSSVSVVANASRLTSWRPGARTASAVAFLARWFAILAVFVPVGWVLIYSVLPVPGTLLMAGRMLEGDGARYDWTPIEDVSPNLVRAVIASEDQSFCDHAGFAWDEIEAAMKRAEKTGKPARGASTITQQTAKNAFLWPGRSYVRKGVEAYFTVLIEAFWSKRRIMEVYLNIAEWGPGVFGAEEAAQHWFKKPARDLTVREAAALAAILPNPRKYKAAQSGPYIAGRTSVITRRAGGVRANGGATCVLKP